VALGILPGVIMLRLPVTVALVAACVAAPAAAQSLRSNEILSSVAVAAVSPPHPVLGADGRVHLAYELMVTNPSHLFVTLDKVEAVDPAGAALWSLEGDALTAMTQMWGGTDRMIDPGGTAIVFMDVSFAADAALPARVAARVTATRQVRGEDGKPAPLPAGTPVPATYSFEAASVAPGLPAVVIDPPLRGDGWVAVNGCCDTITSHRGATMAVNGDLKVPERTAIDWVKLDGDLAYMSELAAVVALGVLEGRWKAANSNYSTASAPAQDSFGGRPGAGFGAGPGTGYGEGAPSYTARGAAPAGGGLFRLSVSFQGMGEWQQISQRLAATPGVGNLEVEGLSARTARIALSFPGSPDDLARALSNQGLSLRNGPDGLRLSGR
jgi:hypothetical protein